MCDMRYGGLICSRTESLEIVALHFGQIIIYPMNFCLEVGV